MKLARPIILPVSVVILLGWILLVLALTPGFQRWAVLREAKKYPTLNLQLESISAGPARITLHGLQLEHRGVKISLGQLEADYSLWSFLINDRLELDQLSVQALVVDASQLSAQKTQLGLAAAPAIAPGALAQIQLPWELSVGTVAIQGRVVLAGNQAGAAIETEFKITGGHIAPGNTGELQLMARTSDPAVAAPVASVTAQATLLIRESRQKSFDFLKLTSVLEASGPGLAGRIQMKLLAEVTRATTGDNYQVQLDTLRAGQSETLLALHASSPVGGQSFTGDWKLSAHAAQVEPFLLGHSLPKFAANGSGRFSLSPSTQGATLQGAVQIEATEFEKFRPELRALGPLRLQSEFALAVEAGLLRFPQLDVTLAGAKPVLELRAIGAPTFALQSRRFAATRTAAPEIFQLKLAGVPVAWAAPLFPRAQLSGGHLTGVISVTQGEGGRLALQTSTPLEIDAISVARAGKTLLTKVSLQLDAGAELSATEFSATIRNALLSTAAGDKLRGKLKVSTTVGTSAPVEVEGDFTADLPALLQPLQPGAAVKATGTVALAWHRDHVDFRRCTLEATDANGDMLASILLSRGFGYHFADGKIATAFATAEETTLANIRIGQLPLVTLLHLYAGYTLSGKPAPAEAILSTTQGKLIVRTGAPVTILDFSLLEKKRPLLDRLKVTLNPELVIEGGTLTVVRSGAITVENATEVPLAQMRAEITQGESGLRAVSTFTLDLPAWTSQPVLLGRDALASGQASGEVRAALVGDAAQIEARATFNTMVALEGGHTLPVVNLSVRTDLDATGKFSVQAPVLLDRAGQRSDLRLAATGQITPLGLIFDGHLTSDHLELPDLLVLLASAGSSLSGAGADSLSAQTRALSPPSADQEAAWSGLTGQFALSCKSVLSGPELIMSDLTGNLTIKGDQLQLEKFEANLGETNRFSAKGALTFEAGLNPYHLTGDFGLTGFDAGKLYRAVNPEQLPTLEGLFSVKAQLAGEGLTFDDTLDRTYGTYDLTSRQGVFRGLKKSSDKLSLATKAVDLLGVFIGDKSAEKIAPATYYADLLAQELSELKYDQLSLRLVREPSLNLRVENISLVSQSLHLLGSGQVTYVAGTPLLMQPFQATLSLRARGKTEELLGKIKVLDGTRDPLGYAKTKAPVLLSGTLTLPLPDTYYLQLGVDKAVDKLGEKLDEIFPAKQ